MHVWLVIWIALAIVSAPEIGQGKVPGSLGPILWVGMASFVYWTLYSRQRPAAAIARGAGAAAGIVIYIIGIGFGLFIITQLLGLLI